jgi:hypothetical protein
MGQLFEWKKERPMDIQSVVMTNFVLLEAEWLITDFFERQLPYDGCEKDYSTKRSREKRARRRR